MKRRVFKVKFLKSICFGLYLNLTMQRIVLTLFLISGISSGLAQTPTWADQVACIVYSHCTSCHNPKGAAPFSLLDYDTAVTYAASIRHDVENGIMPPWPVDNSFRKMAHDRSL